MSLIAKNLAIQNLIARNLTSKGLTIEGPDGVAVVYTFDFTTLLTALPPSLTALSATYTRSGTKYNLQNNKFVAYGANQFGTSFDPTAGAYGYLAEKAATNLFTYSKDFSNAAWTKTGGLILASDPDSSFDSNTSFSVTPPASFGHNFVRATILAPSGVLSTVSFIVKANGLRYVSIGRVTTNSTVQNWVFDLVAGNIFQNPVSPDYTNGTIIPLGDDWYRVSVNVNSTTAAVRQVCLYLLSNTPTTPVTNNVSLFTGNAVDGILLDHAQLETDEVASSPIITVAATASRAADVLSVASANIPEFTESEYTLFSDYRVLKTSNFERIMNLVDVTQTNTAYIARDAANVRGNVFRNGVQQAGLAILEATVSRVKSALSAKINIFRLSHNGAGATPDTSGTMPENLTTLEIAHAASTPADAYVFNSQLITKATGQSELDTLTT